MREIKFRIWCKNKNEWEQDLCALLPNGDIAEVKFLSSNSMRTLNRENHILELYTGLKDKNGKEIYEGDIIKYGTLFVVEWDQYFCRFHRKSLTIKSNGICQVFPICEIEEKEIIGNIHQPEGE